MYQKIKKLCESNGMNITNLCIEVTGSGGNLSTWKKGYMRSDCLLKIADKFDCSVDYLLGRTNSPNCITNGDISNSSVAQANGDNNQISIQSNNENPYAEIIEHLDSLSPAERRHAIADLMDVLESQYPVKKK